MVSNYLAHSRYNTLTSTAKHLSFHSFSFLFTNKPHKTLTLQREKNFNYPEATIINIWGVFLLSIFESIALGFVRNILLQNQDVC